MPGFLAMLRKAGPIKRHDVPGDCRPRLFPQTGQVVLRGPVAELRETELTRQAYLGEFKVA
jgi:hypothetical protein